MFVLSIAGSAVFFAIAAIHAYWFFGGTIGTDRYIQPDKHGKRINPGKPLIFLATLMFVAAGLIPLVALGIIALPIPRWLLDTVLIAGIVVLLVRGVGGFFWSLLQKKPRDIFHRWNLGLYTWLCLFLALSYGACLFA